MKRSYCIPQQLDKEKLRKNLPAKVVEDIRYHEAILHLGKPKVFKLVLITGNYIIILPLENSTGQSERICFSSITEVHKKSPAIDYFDDDEVNRDNEILSIETKDGEYNFLTFEPNSMFSAMFIEGWACFLEREVIRPKKCKLNERTFGVLFNDLKDEFIHEVRLDDRIELLSEISQVSWINSISKKIFLQNDDLLTSNSGESIRGFSNFLLHELRKNDRTRNMKINYKYILAILETFSSVLFDGFWIPERLLLVANSSFSFTDIIELFTLCFNSEAFENTDKKESLQSLSSVSVKDNRKRVLDQIKSIGDDEVKVEKEISSVLNKVMDVQVSIMLECNSLLLQGNTFKSSYIPNTLGLTDHLLHLKGFNVWFKVFLKRYIQLLTTTNAAKATPKLEEYDKPPSKSTGMNICKPTCNREAQLCLWKYCKLLHLLVMSDYHIRELLREEYEDVLMYYIRSNKITNTLLESNNYFHAQSARFMKEISEACHHIEYMCKP